MREDISVINLTNHFKSNEMGQRLKNVFHFYKFVTLTFNMCIPWNLIINNHAQVPSTVYFIKWYIVVVAFWHVPVISRVACRQVPMINWVACRQVPIVSWEDCRQVPMMSCEDCGQVPINMGKVPDARTQGAKPALSFNPTALPGVWCSYSCGSRDTMQHNEQQNKMKSIQYEERKRYIHTKWKRL